MKEICSNNQTKILNLYTLCNSRFCILDYYMRFCIDSVVLCFISSKSSGFIPVSIHITKNQMLTDTTNTIDKVHYANINKTLEKLFTSGFGCVFWVVGACYRSMNDVLHYNSISNHNICDWTFRTGVWSFSALIRHYVCVYVMCSV